jgi:hypothetical protein
MSLGGLGDRRSSIVDRYRLSSSRAWRTGPAPTGRSPSHRVVAIAGLRKRISSDRTSPAAEARSGR